MSKQAEINNGFSSLVFLLTLGNGLFLDLFTENGNCILSLVFSFAFSALLVALFNFIQAQRNGNVKMLITVFVSAFLTIYQVFRVKAYIDCLAEASALYTKKSVAFFAIIIIYAVTVCFFFKGKDALTRTAMLCVPFVVILFALLFPLVKSQMSSVLEMVANQRPSSIVGIVKNGIVSSILIVADSLCVFLLYEKKQSQRGKLTGITPVAMAYLLVAIVSIMFCSLDLQANLSDAGRTSAMLLFDNTCDVKLGAVLIVVYTITLLLRLSAYLMLAGKTVEIIKERNLLSKSDNFFSGKQV